METVKTICLPPSFLQEFCNQNQCIYLIYKSKIPEENTRVNMTLNQTESSCVDLELTGSPLKIDLKGNESTILHDILSDKEDFKYHPLTLKEARKQLQMHENNKENNTTEFQKYLPVYCICDGEDPEKTFILGSTISSHSFTRSVVYDKGIVSFSNQYEQIQNMISEHLSKISYKNTKIKYHVQFVYYLYGHKLKPSVMIQNSDTSGSILAEVFWDTPVFDLPAHISTSKISLQVLIGHKISKVFHLWCILSSVHRYLQILSLPEKNILCTHRLSSYDYNNEDIIEEIGSILLESSSMFQKEFQSKQELKTFDFNCESILNVLFLQLNRCNTISDLQECFVYIFKEIVSKPNVKFYIPDDDKTLFGVAVKNILKSMISIPSLSPKQSLEFLSDLAVETLQHNYLSIFKSFDYMLSEKIVNNWQKFTVDKQASSHRGRTTITPLLLEMNLSNVSKKHNTLTKMHVIVEFLLLLEQNCKFSKELMNCISQSAVEKFLNKSELCFNDVLEERLCELEVHTPLGKSDVEFIRNKNLSSWILEMNSYNKISSVKTKYLQTRSPLFPLSVCDKYENESVLEKEEYYVTEGVTYCNTFF